MECRRSAFGGMECWARSEALALSWNNGQKRITSVFVYPMNRIIFQLDATPMVPIIHHSIVPLFQL